MVVWDRMFCLGMAEISSLVFLVLFKVGCRLSPGLHTWVVFRAGDAVGGVL